MSGLGCVLGLVIMLVLGVVIRLIYRWSMTTPVPPDTQTLYEQLSQSAALTVFPPGSVDYGIAGYPNTHPYMTQPCILVFSSGALEIYNFNGTRIAYRAEDIVWYGTFSAEAFMPLPRRHNTAADQSGGRRGMVTHVFTQGRWFRVLLVMMNEDNTRLFNALRELKPHLERHLPFSPFAPAMAQVLRDGQHRGVNSGEKVRLWFSPLELVVMRGLQDLLRVAVSSIDNVEARKPDSSTPLADTSMGVLRIETRDGVLEYALAGYAEFAVALAAAAGITPLLPAGYVPPKPVDGLSL